MGGVPVMLDSVEYLVGTLPAEKVSIHSRRVGLHNYSVIFGRVLCNGRPVVAATAHSYGSCLQLTKGNFNSACQLQCSCLQLPQHFQSAPILPTCLGNLHRR